MIDYNLNTWHYCNFLRYLSTLDFDEIELKLKIKFSVEMMKSVEIIEGEQSR